MIDDVDLAAIVKIRELRESRAASALRQARELVTELELSLHRQQDQMASFRHTRLHSERVLFEKMRGQAVPPPVLVSYQEAVTGFQARESGLQEGIGKTKANLTEARKGLTQAKDSWQQSRKAREALSELHIEQRNRRRDRKSARDEEAGEETVAANYRPKTEGAP